MTADPLLTLVTETFELLRQTQPLADQPDICWHGPYYIPRSGVWQAPSRATIEYTNWMEVHPDPDSRWVSGEYGQA